MVDKQAYFLFNSLFFVLSSRRTPAGVRYILRWVLIDRSARARWKTEDFVRGWLYGDEPMFEKFEFGDCQALFRFCQVVGLIRCFCDKELETFCFLKKKAL